MPLDQFSASSIKIVFVNGVKKAMIILMDLDDFVLRNAEMHMLDLKIVPINLSE
jgi:hypothetical protein